MSAFLMINPSQFLYKLFLFYSIFQTCLFLSCFNREIDPDLESIVQNISKGIKSVLLTEKNKRAKMTHLGEPFVAP